MTTFEHAYRELWPAVRAALARRSGDPWLAEDLAQEAFFSAWIHWDGFAKADDDGARRGWLHGIAVRKLIDHKRRPYSPEWYDQARLRGAAWLSGGPYDSAEPALDRLTLHALPAVLPRLKPTYRVVLEARFLAGRRVRDTAARLGVSEMTVKNRTRAGLARLRRLLAEVA